jgi:hypothetical protein
MESLPGACALSKDLNKAWRKYMGNTTLELTSYDTEIEPPAIDARFRAMAERCHLDETSGEVRLTFQEDHLDISLSRGLVKKMELTNEDPLVVAIHKGRKGLLIGRHPTGLHHARTGSDGAELTIPLSDGLRQMRIEQLGVTQVQPAIATDRVIFTPLQEES